MRNLWGLTVLKRVAGGTFGSCVLTWEWGRGRGYGPPACLLVNELPVTRPALRKQSPAHRIPPVIVCGECRGAIVRRGVRQLEAE